VPWCGPSANRSAYPRRSSPRRRACDRQSINRVENAAYSPSLDRVFKLADALGLSLSDLFDEFDRVDANAPTQNGLDRTRRSASARARSWGTAQQPAEPAATLVRRRASTRRRTRIRLRGMRPADR
jgi:DNA-binding XRE family transcriptional regulator